MSLRQRHALLALALAYLPGCVSVHIAGDPDKPPTVHAVVSLGPYLHRCTGDAKE
jgi:hypothetical protein